MIFINRGRDFEIKFANALNDHYFNELNSNLKRFITFIFKDFNLNDKIYCKKIRKNEKADIFIKIGSNIKYISLKSGSENSIHVEKLRQFINFLLNLGVEKNIIDNLLIYHYGDDTLIGNGKKRYSANESKLRYKDEIMKFNNFISKSNTMVEIIDRFIFVGNDVSNNRVDAIYYGDLDIGIWCTRKELLNYCLKHKCMHINTPHFSSLVYQNWCRNVLFNKKSESHREYIQIKWFSILSDLTKIRNN